MKLVARHGNMRRPVDFSTLDSGLRDETGQYPPALRESPPHFSTLDSGLRDETGAVSAGHPGDADFSTLDSGLRDETQGGM